MFPFDDFIMISLEFADGYSTIVKYAHENYYVSTSYFDDLNNYNMPFYYLWILVTIGAIKRLFGMISKHLNDIVIISIISFTKMFYWIKQVWFIQFEPLIVHLCDTWDFSDVTPEYDSIYFSNKGMDTHIFIVFSVGRMHASHSKSATFNQLSITKAEWHIYGLKNMSSGIEITAFRLFSTKSLS